MAHFAQVDDDNIVIQVVVVPDEQEHRGQEFLADDLHLGGTWVQTSYNTRGGVHELGGTPLRGNFASIGCPYDPERDVFLSQPLYPSMVLNEETFLWEFPTPFPGVPFEEPFYKWDEDTISWVEMRWDEDTTSWIEVTE